MDLKTKARAAIETLDEIRKVLTLYVDGETVWIDAKGRRHTAETLDTGHLYNIVHMLKRKGTLSAKEHRALVGELALRFGWNMERQTGVTKNEMELRAMSLHTLRDRIIRLGQIGESTTLERGVLFERLGHGAYAYLREIL